MLSRASVRPTWMYNETTGHDHPRPNDPPRGDHRHHRPGAEGRGDVRPPLGPAGDLLPAHDGGVSSRAGQGDSPMTTTETIKPPARVMSIHAHPDDQEFTVAGTLATWARAG